MLEMEKVNKTRYIEDEMPPHVYEILHEFLLGVNDKDLDLRQPHMRPSMANIYVFFLFIYAILIVVGVLINLAVLLHIFRYKLYQEPTYAFMVNGSISDILKCIVVLPISLYVLLIQNWVLGELLCSFLPMVQDIPLHSSTLTFVLMAWDRLRYVRNPGKSRMPAFVCAVGTWLTALCLVLPYPIYVTYVDIGKHVPSFEGVGICIVNLSDDMQEYMRGIFIITYAGPLATISYLYVKVSRELETQENYIALMMEVRNREGRHRVDSHSTATDCRASRAGSDGTSQYSRSSFRDHFRNNRDNLQQLYDSELDVVKERRTQKYLVATVTAYGILLCPLMVLRLARLALIETYDNTGHFDITYAILVWVGFLPTCSTPGLYFLWQMNRPTKERLRGYFRFSNRKLRQSCEAVVTSTNDGASNRRSMPARHSSYLDPRRQDHDQDSNSNTSSIQELT
ncbi:alpha-1A adrenergic receptor [Agrilus planipennis]|uniref:Alpha-1A adrenergic receptor n=1 Tax=Agrilus planipennis TaxID=224129 RepID=A0A1W4X7Z8_AGRPL|nr:alpha-1A adrenergic receptor [Agrilus planipennis]XP_018328528.1 alpha-1A adrenergic receptor [Agrilus planipennis]